MRKRTPPIEMSLEPPDYIAAHLYPNTGREIFISINRTIVIFISSTRRMWKRRRKCIASKQKQNDSIRRATDDTDIVHRTDEDDAPLVNLPCELLSSAHTQPTNEQLSSSQSLSAMQLSPCCQVVEVAKERPNQTLRSISDIAIDNNSRTATIDNDTEPDTKNCDLVTKSVHYIDGRDTTYQDIKYYDHYGTELSVITRVYYRPYTSVEENRVLFYSGEDYAKFRRLASIIFTLEDRTLFYCIKIRCDEQSGAVTKHEPRATHECQEGGYNDSRCC